MARALTPSRALSAVGQPFICGCDLLHLASGIRDRHDGRDRTGFLSATAPIVRIVGLHGFPRSSQFCITKTQQASIGSQTEGLGLGGRAGESTKRATAGDPAPALTFWLRH